MPEKTHRKPGRVAVSAKQTSADRLTDVLSKSQRGYRELIDNLDQALFTLSSEGVIRVANLRLSQILGAPFPDLIGRKLTDFIESPTAAEFERALPVLLSEGTWSGSVPVRLRQDSEIRYFSCWLQAVEDEDRLHSVIGWARDITAQHESELRFADLFESLREGIVFSTPEGQILDANPALVRMLGFESKDALLRRNFTEFYEHPEDRAKFISVLQEKGSVQNREIVLRRQDGRKLHCLASGLVVRNSSGQIVRLQGTLVDVTERMEIEKKLHREQEFGRQLIECFPDLIAVMDREGRFTYMSDRVRDLLGVTPQEYLGRRIGSATHSEDRGPLWAMVQEIVNGKSNYSQVESRVRHADGEWRTLRTSASPMFDEEGRITGVVASVRDVTEANRAEQRNVQNEKFAAMGQMMAGAAHELNNPLTAILGVSDLLRDRATDDNTRRQIDLVLQQARRAAGIVQNLLAFSRPSAQGRAKLRLDEILQDVIRVHSPSLSAKNITVELHAPANVSLVEGDRRLLTQVFSNLLSNAEQAISASRERGSIDITLKDSSGGVSVTMVDDGPGIPTENLSKIFDPFFTTKRPGGGSGLGLTICLAVVKDHGGTIEVNPAPSGGAAFQVVLPRAVKESAPATRVSRPARKPPAGSEALSGRTVLIVDDEESIREIVREGLTARGMKVHEVASSEEALAYLEKNSCDVVLCDYNLPGMSGEKFFERFFADRRTSQLPRFVFMTGELVESESFDRLRQKGSSVLQKPFHIGALASLLTDLLQPQPA